MNILNQIPPIVWNGYDYSLLIVAFMVLLTLMMWAFLVLNSKEN